MGVAGGGDVGDGTVDHENQGDGASDADDPLDGAEQDGAGVGELVTFGADHAVFGGETGGEVEIAAGAQGDADGVQDDVRGEGDGEADEGLGEGLFAGGGFGGVAGGENIEVAAVDDVADGEIRGDDDEVDGDVGDDGPDGFGEQRGAVDAVKIDIAVPGDQTDKNRTVAARTSIGVGRNWCEKGCQQGNGTNQTD